MRVTLDADIPLYDGEEAGWDGDAARAAIFAWSGYDDAQNDAQRAEALSRAERLFLLRRDEGDTKDDCVAPCGVIADGEPRLSRAGMRYALAAVNGARGGIDAPEDVLSEARALLQRLLGEAQPDQGSIAKSVPLACKVATTEDGALIARGYAVVFGGADLYGESFSPTTDFGDEWMQMKHPPVFYEHTLHPQVGFAVLGHVRSMRMDDIGLLVEAELDRHSQYIALVQQLANAGALGFSTGAAQHLVRREGKSITRWPIIEVSLTPTPAEPRTLGVEVVQAIRALVGAPESDAAGQAAHAVRSEARDEARETQADKSNQSNHLEVMTMTNATVAGGPYMVADPAQKHSVGAFLRSVALRDSAALKAMGSSVGETGGYLMPETTVDELLSAMTEASIFLSRVYMVRAAGTVRQPVIDISLADNSTYAWFGGVQLTWQTEGAAISETEPRIKQYTLRALTLSGITRVSNRLLTATNVDRDLRDLFARAIASYIDWYCMRGTGVGQPLGILNAPALVTVTRASAGQVSASDVANMYARLIPGSAARAVWLVHPSVLPQLMTIAVGNTPVWMPDFRQGSAGQLMGLPILVTETARALGSTGDIVLADLNAYAVQMASNVEIAVSEHAYFANDQTAYRVVVYADGQPRYADKAKWIGTNTEVSPFVALG
jgi:HK97 family phage major capsid protein